MDSIPSLYRGGFLPPVELNAFQIGSLHIFVLLAGCESPGSLYGLVRSTHTESMIAVQLYLT